LKISRLVAAVLTATSLLVSTTYAQEAPAGEGQPDGARSIQAIVTGYANGADNGAVGTTTATGVETHWGTVAADWRAYPPGTRLQIEGFPNDVFMVEDSGGAVRGDVFDIWFPDLATAVAFGTKSLRVTVLP
jgi:3D (Asp-Asp-Asp) domain-containing protein